ncbi:hypothetical protein [Tenacibaculum piscium]|uniref:hypothetical protein n=1 Tax=Tenacibaculum piscium TaxID=1458515 RepID=UPI001F3A60D6|nr:hypothetical protein [Tenacibaculum piscium]
MRNLKTSHLQIKPLKNASSLATDAKGNVIAGGGRNVQKITLQNQKLELNNNQVNDVLYVNASPLLIVINLDSIKKIGDSITVVNTRKNMKFIFTGGADTVYDTISSMDRKGTIYGFTGGDRARGLNYHCLSKVITKISETDYLIN